MSARTVLLVFVIVVGVAATALQRYKIHVIPDRLLEGEYLVLRIDQWAGGRESVYISGAYDESEGLMLREVLMLKLGGWIEFPHTIFIRGNHIECEACVSFGERTNCGTADGVSEAEARRAAITLACVPLTSGVVEVLACDREEPVSVRCK